ncbi:hypothetical protein AVEN_264231-1 [Araneus ventricosus]|uniref:Uncharacterized protein n=1 Tax=Araneus ventricosus TaxID=182803 RepID=A0A4Y2NMA2_ARAVE|nr:hypothetical protein AVEN_264231-1 [Araneus ventricosus]
MPNLALFSFIILTPRFEATRDLFLDRYREFEVWLDEEDDILDGILSSNFHNIIVRGRHSTSDLRFTKPTYRMDILWNRVLNLKPIWFFASSTSEVETFPPGRYGHPEKNREIWSCNGHEYTLFYIPIRMLYLDIAILKEVDQD